MRNQENILFGPPLATPMEDGTAGRYILKTLKRYSDLPRCITEPETGLTISYKQLLITTCRLAQSFINNGYSRDTVISICSGNNINFMYPVIASLYVGIVVAPINPNYTEREFLHVLNVSKPKIIFCSINKLTKMLRLKQKLDFIEKIVILDCENNTEDIESLTSFIDGACSKDFNVEEFQPCDFNRNEQVAVVLCSSGTTGVPKCAMLTHKNVMMRLVHAKDPNFGTAQHVKNGGAVLNSMPTFHIFGFLLTLGYVTLGLHIVQMKRFQEELFLQSIEKYKVESTIIVPTIMTFLVKSSLVDNYDLSSLKEIGCGSAPLPKEISVTLRDRLNIDNIRQGYGSTETTLVVTLTPLNSRKIGSIGKLLPLNQMKIINPDTEKSLGPYEEGELCVNGDIVMKGYMNNIEATQNSIDQDGWFHTADIGYYDEDEYFYVVDRIKELIKYKGYQVAPAELEALLLEHPNIKEVAVVGKADPIAGELPTAFVVTQPDKTITENEIHEFLKDKISYEKRLRGGIIQIDAIPRNATGKILRRELRLMLHSESKL